MAPGGGVTFLGYISIYMSMSISILVSVYKENDAGRRGNLLGRRGFGEE